MKKTPAKRFTSRGKCNHVEYATIQHLVEKYVRPKKRVKASLTSEKTNKKQKSSTNKRSR